MSRTLYLEDCSGDFARAPLHVSLALFTALAASAASAHGPQIQITNSGNKIVTRELLLDSPYSPAVTAPKSVYVLALLPFSDVWYSHPNGAIDPITQLPAFPSGPGLAYGSDLADGGPQSFVAGSVLSINFADGLKLERCIVGQMQARLN